MKSGDPLSWNNYIYGVDFSRYKYQIATVLEDKQASIFMKQVYADVWYTAKVVWNYPWILKTKNTIYNIPSLIFTNTWEIELTWTWVNFIVDKLANLPYKVWKVTNLDTLSPTEVFEKITGKEWITLIWVEKPKNMAEFNNRLVPK